MLTSTRIGSIMVAASGMSSRSRALAQLSQQLGVGSPRIFNHSGKRYESEDPMDLGMLSEQLKGSNGKPK